MNLHNLLNSNTEFEHIKAQYFTVFGLHLYFCRNQPGSVLYKFSAFEKIMKLVSQLHTLTQITYPILSIYVLPPTDFNEKSVIRGTEKRV